MQIRFRSLLAVALMAHPLIFSSPAVAGWKLVPAQAPQTLNGLTVIPAVDWNLSSAKPGKQGQLWTRDGAALNALELFAGVPDGQPLYRERNRKLNPLPRFERSMLAPDLADFFERSFRASRKLSDFRVEQVVPSRLGAQPGVLVRYAYTLPNDDLARRGEARLVVAGGQLHAINFHAPALHYFDAGIPDVRAMAEAARIASR